MSADSRVPDLRKLSIALLEHSVEPIIGTKAIELARAPVEEKQLRETLANAVRTSEQRFVREYPDTEISEALLGLPLSDLSSLHEAIRAFYDQPADTTLLALLKERLIVDFPHLSADRVQNAISYYIDIVREELIPVSKGIREKLNTLSLLRIEHNTERIAENFEFIRAAYYNPNEVAIVRAPPPKAKQKQVRRELIYEITSHSTIDEIRNNWKFLSSSPMMVDLTDGILGVGDPKGQSCSFPQMDPLPNCSVESSIRILEVGNNDASLWAGIRLRGFTYDFRFGYLGYLRKQGTVELYRAQEVIGGANEQRVSDTEKSWTPIRIDIFRNRIQVWVSGNLHINVTDKKFSDTGQVFLHTYSTRAEFQNLKIYKLKQ